MPWSVSDGGILEPVKIFPKTRDRDGSSGGASTSSIDSISSATTASTGKRDSTGSQSTTQARQTSLKTPKSPEKEGARQLARNFFSRKSSSRASTTTLQHVEEKELTGSLERVNSTSSSKSSKTGGAFSSMRNGFLGGPNSRESTVQLKDSSWIESKINARTSSKRAISVNTNVIAPLNEAELKQLILQATKDTRCESPLSPTQMPQTPETPVMRKLEMPPPPKMMPILHKKPLGPRQNADWDLDPVATIEEEDELLDGLSWIEDDTDSKRVSSNDTISEPLTIHSRDHSANSSTAEIPMILDQSCLGPDNFRQLDGMTLVESVPILLDLKDPPKALPSPPLSQPPSLFLLELENMESSGLHSICEHLGDDTEVSEESAEFFEKRLWALMACQWLTFGKQLQSPAHDTLFNARPEEDRKVLHLHGPAADGWVFAAKYPNATFYSVSSQDVVHPNNSYTMPPNHHHLFTPAVSSPVPFPDNYFDVVVTRTLSSVMKSDELESVLRESLRILRPGGWLELHTIDPTLTKAGNITKHWIESRVLAPMETDFYSARPSDRILNLMTELGYHHVKNARIALPTFATVNTRPVSLGSGNGGTSDAQKVMVHLGRHFYEELYGQFLRAGHIGEGSPTWWWDSMAVRQECERENTCFGLTISFGRKKR